MAENYDRIVSSMTPMQRNELLRWADRGLKAIEEDKAQTPVPKPAAPAGDPRDARLAKMEAQLAEMNARAAADEQKKANEAAEKEFFGTVGGIIGADAALAKDEDAKALITELALGALVEHKRKFGDSRVFDVAGTVRDRIAKVRKMTEKMSRKEKSEWMRDKHIAAEETIGETTAGSPPASEEPKISGEGFLRGDVGEMLARELRGG